MAENNATINIQSMPLNGDEADLDKFRQYKKYDRAIQILKGAESIANLILTIIAFGIGIFLFAILFNQIAELNQQMAGTNSTIQRMNMNDSIDKLNGTIQRMEQINAFIADKCANFWATCGHTLAIDPDGFGVTHSPIYTGNGMARAANPNYLLKYTSAGKYVVAYFEVAILYITASQPYSTMNVGFCDKQFPLAGSMLGDHDYNSIGLFERLEMIAGAIINGDIFEFEEPHSRWIEAGDVVGSGLLYSSTAPSGPLKYFATLNGILLGTINLPPKFANISLYPAFSSWGYSDAVRANFGAEMWHFGNLSQLINAEE